GSTVRFITVTTKITVVAFEIAEGILNVYNLKLLNLLQVYKIYYSYQNCRTGIIHFLCILCMNA
ncbi:hypothetical protein L9F63_013709, partial [Diploptera punctata]